MGRLQRYFWPKTALIFWHDKEKIDAAFGYVAKDGVEIVQRRSILLSERSELTNWYNEIIKTYPKTYVVAMLDTLNQGALPECGKSALERFGVDATLVHTLCVEDRWLVYSSVVEMKWFEQKFKGLTFDLLFSPFLILWYRARPRLDDRPTLTLLHFKGTVFMAVFSEEKLLYAQVMAIAETVQQRKEGEEAIDDSITFDLEMIEEEDVEPIADIDVLGEFSGEVEREEENIQDEDALEKLEYTLTLFEELKQAIAKFYHDKRYPQAFIEKVLIYDTDALGEDLIRYIEDELFIQATMESMDPLETMAQLSAEELGG